MKRNLLLACMATCLGTVSLNAENVTPNNLLFKNHALGNFQITSGGEGANPAVDLGTPGHVVMACGSAAVAKLLPVLMESASIVSSPYGNLLMIKGKDSSVEDGIPAKGSLNTGWWNMNFIGPRSELNQKYRATIQMKLVTDMTPEVDEARSIKVNYVTGGGNNMSLGSYESIYLGDEGWFQTQLEGTIGTADPARLRIEMPGGIMDKSALYIYEVRFEKNPSTPAHSSANDGTPGNEKPIGSVETALNQLPSTNEVFVAWDREKIYINQAADKLVRIFAISGQKVKEFTASESFVEIPMERGIYLVQIEEQLFKVVL